MDGRASGVEFLRANREKSEIKTLREGRDPRGGLPSPLYASASHLGGASEVDVLQASMGFSCGLSESQVAESYGEQAADLAQSRKHKGAGLHAAMDFVLAAAGKPRKGRVDSDYLRAVFEADRDLRAASSTISLEGILSNVANKQMEAGYNAVEVVWPLFCSPKPTPDFKPNFFYRMTGFGAMQQVGPTGELKHIELTEQQFTATNDTWVRHHRNPAHDARERRYGGVRANAADLWPHGFVSLEEQIFTLLMSNPEISGVNFFSTTNGNYSSGSGSALSTSSLATAVKLFRSQQDPNGKPILLSPRTLLVGQSNEQAAKVAIGSSDLIQTALQTITECAGGRARQPSGQCQPILAAAQRGRQSVAGDGRHTRQQCDCVLFVWRPAGDRADLCDVSQRRSSRRSRQRKRTSAASGCECVHFLIMEWGLATTARRTSQPEPDRIVLPLASTGLPRRRGRGIFKWKGGSGERAGRRIEENRLGLEWRPRSPRRGPGAGDSPAGPGSAVGSGECSS